MLLSGFEWEHLVMIWDDFWTTMDPFEKGNLEDSSSFGRSQKVMGIYLPVGISGFYKHAWAF